MYFMMTTMSTVGFGDMHPKSDAERLVCILIFLLGGALFGIVMGDLIDIIEEVRELYGEIDETDQLN